MGNNCTGTRDSMHLDSYQQIRKKPTLFAGRKSVEIGQENAVKSVKMVIVGASSVGKTCLITNYTKNAFSNEHIPNILDVFSGSLEIDGK